MCPCVRVCVCLEGGGCGGLYGFFSNFFTRFEGFTIFPGLLHEGLSDSLPSLVTVSRVTS